MELESQLYWILLESELNDPDLYFPPDTPVGKANPKRLYAMLKKRHIRQRERLIHLQKNELEEYQRKFSVEYREDLFIRPTRIAFEPVKGSDYLTDQSHAISELLSSIPDIIIENQHQIAKPKESHQSNSKREELLEILKRKFDNGFEAINKKHYLQLDALQDLQKEDMSVIPREFLDPPPYSAIKRGDRSYHMSPSSPPPQHSPTRKRMNDYEERSHKRRKDYRDVPGHYENKETYDHSRHKHDRDYLSNQSRAHVPGAGSPKMNKANPTSYSLDGRPSAIKFDPPSNIRVPTSIHTPNNNKLPPTVISTPTNKLPPTVISTPTNKLQPTVSSSNKLPPTVGTSSSSSKDTRRDSLPLFHNKPVNHRIVSLLDQGTLLIQNKPNRVIIRGPGGVSANYGNPKDYDDAINSSVERPDNPVYKRRSHGQEFLFYKTPTGKVVTIGPVSKIQPLIHKFFLSM